jgi:polysaccharide export outer membrane protein
LILDGYKVEKDSTINYPVLGEISVVGLTTNELAIKLRNMLINEGQLTNPHIRINKVNSKFTVLGEVRNPGTYFNYENQLNIFQALGFAGDLLITAKRKNVKLIRQENGLRKTYKFSLNTSEIFDKPYYYIKSNDVIIIEPNFSKIKSAGFIGSPASIASISSLVLSITLLLIK